MMQISETVKKAKEMFDLFHAHFCHASLPVQPSPYKKRADFSTLTANITLGDKIRNLHRDLLPNIDAVCFLLYRYGKPA